MLSVLTHEQNASNGAHYFIKAHNFIETQTIQFNVNLKTTTGEKDFFFLLITLK